MESEREVRDGVDRRLIGDRDVSSGMLFSDKTWKDGRFFTIEKVE